MKLEEHRVGECIENKPFIKLLVFFSSVMIILTAVYIAMWIALISSTAVTLILVALILLVGFPLATYTLFRFVITFVKDS